MGVPDELPVKTLRELLDHARANPSGMGSDILDKLVEGVREAYTTPRIRELHAFYGIPNAPVVSLADARRIWDSDSVQWISMSEKLGITLE